LPVKCGFASWWNALAAGTLIPTPAPSPRTPAYTTTRGASTRDSIEGEETAPAEERKAVSRRAEEAINQKDVRILDEHPGYWQTRQVFPLLFGAFPDLSATVEQQTVDGAWVTTRTTMTGTPPGDFMGIAPTGRTVLVMNISLDHVTDGRVVEYFGASDRMAMLVTLGLVVAPATSPAGPKR
jgi:predicted ester cyclase